MGAVRPKNGSMCFNKLVDALEAGHSAFYKGDDGNTYFNFAMWENAEPDQYNNLASFQLNSAKGSDDKKVYFGNIKAPKVPKQENPF